MRTAATKRLPLLAVLRHQRDKEGFPTQNGGRGRRQQSSRSSSKGSNTFAFLGEGLQDIPIKGHLGKYEIDFNGSYKKIRAAMERFLSAHNLKLNYSPKRGDDDVKKLSDLTDHFEKLLEPMDYHCMLHKDEYNPILDCGVYAYGDGMDYTIGELYVRPAHTLPDEEAMLFKRFMSYFSKQTNIGLGLDGDSFFLETQADWFAGEYDDIDSIDDDEKEEYLFRQRVINDYKTGEYKQLFDEIAALDVDGGELARDLQAYLKRYKGVAEKFDEWRLMGVLLDGIEIASFINIYDWTWDPESDGVDDNHDDNYYTATSLLNFILYSEHDTFGESVLDAVNNGADEMLGWCNVLVITRDNNFDERMEHFEQSISYIPKFRQWLQDFYQTAEKFDTNEYTERTNEG